MTSPNMQGQQQNYFPPMPDNRRRSSSYTDRYRPASYSNPPSYQADPNLLGPHQYPVSPAPMPTPGQPPYPAEYPTGSAHGSPYMEVPNVAQHQLAGELGSRRPSATMYPDGLKRPSYDGSQMRRPSHDSRLSHRSERSHRSHHSHHSRRSHYNEDDDDDDDDRRHHEHKHHQLHRDLQDRDAYRRHRKERGDNVSRSFGESLVSFFGPLKYLFEPRDKY